MVLHFFMYDYVLVLKVLIGILLCHLQRLVDVGGQDGQEVVYATDQEGSCRTTEENHGMTQR